jgi:rhamnogalacturonyl hydrolase YesR
MINPTVKSLKFIIDNPKKTALDFSIPNNQERWSWSDALFMAPPTFAKVGKITGDKKYFEFMNSEFWTTYDTLYSKKDSLFFRDTRYKAKKEANGQNIYWSRGNGWVIGGLTMIIDNLPENHPSKQRYISLFKQMMSRITHLQDEKGLWHPSLLDYKTYPMPESSSSSFFTYGLAWGINRGYLDRKTFEPSALKGWQVLTSLVHQDGKLGWVQEIGADPTKVSYDDSEVYGVGAFLLAGSEILMLSEK